MKVIGLQTGSQACHWGTSDKFQNKLFEIELVLVDCRKNGLSLPPYVKMASPPCKRSRQHSIAFHQVQWDLSVPNFQYPLIKNPSVHGKSHQNEIGHSSTSEAQITAVVWREKLPNNSFVVLHAFRQVSFSFLFVLRFQEHYGSLCKGPLLVSYLFPRPRESWLAMYVIIEGHLYALTRISRAPVSTHETVAKKVQVVLVLHSGLPLRHTCASCRFSWYEIVSAENGKNQVKPPKINPQHIKDQSTT